MKQDQYILLIWELLHCSTYQLVLEIIPASTIAQTSAAKETDTLHIGSNNDKKEEPIKKPSNIKYGDSIGDNSKSDKSSKSDNSDESNEEDKPDKVSSSWIVIACVFGALIGCIIGAVLLTKGGGVESEPVPIIENKEAINSENAAVRTYTVKGVSFDMVSGKGGSFTMGATSEQCSDAESDEKPAHRVTLSDYMIGKNQRACDAKQKITRATRNCRPRRMILEKFYSLMCLWSLHCVYG